MPGITEVPLEVDIQEQRDRWPSQGFAKLLGIEFDHAEEGFARLKMRVEKQHTQMANTAHGGILATIAEAAAAQAMITLLKDDEFFTTIELNLNYLSPANPGESIVGEGRIIQRGGRIAVGDMEVKESSSGRLIVKGLHTFMIIRSKG